MADARTEEPTTTEPSRRRDPRAFVAAAFPVAVVVVSIAVPRLRWAGVVVLVAGFALARYGRRRGSGSAHDAALQDGSPRDGATWMWAAMVPLGVRIAWGDFAAMEPGIADCGNLLAPAAMDRLIEAAVVLGTVAAVAATMPGSRKLLSLRLPSRRTMALSLALPIIAIPIGLAVGPALARPFFGPIPIETGIPSAIIPALILALSNATLEEVVFRGAVLGWGGRSVGLAPALWLQAILFGLVHVGPDFVSPLAAAPVLVAVTAGGLIAGVIVRRTGSLLLPIAVHVAADVPLFYAFSCRLPVAIP